MYAKNFNGADIEDMVDFVNPITRRKPDKVILHVSANEIAIRTRKPIK